LVVALVVAGCRTAGEYVPVEKLPAAQPQAEYRIGPGDVLGIRVWNQESMSTARARVREDGKISVPFLQDVNVSGMTPAELANQLQAKLKAYIVNPVVTVTQEEIRPLRVSVVGEVVRPGQYELDRGAGVLAALAAAGGITEYGHRNEIFVLRPAAASGKPPTRIRFGYPSLVRAEWPAAGFQLRSGDVVVVE
jgi:polysaccharide export outer membrane protein